MNNFIKHDGECTKFLEDIISLELRDLFWIHRDFARPNELEKNLLDAMHKNTNFNRAYLSSGIDSERQYPAIVYSFKCDTIQKIFEGAEILNKKIWDEAGDNNCIWLRRPYTISQDNFGKNKHLYYVSIRVGYIPIDKVTDVINTTNLQDSC